MERRSSRSMAISKAGSTKASRGKRTHQREDGNEPDPLGLNMVPNHKVATKVVVIVLWITDVVVVDTKEAVSVAVKVMVVGMT